MKISFLIILCFEFCDAFSQNGSGTDTLEWARINKSYAEFSDKNQFDSALVYAKKAVDAAIPVFGKNHINYAASLHNLAYTYASLNQYNLAEKYYVECLEAKKRIVGEETAQYIFTARKLASLYEKMKSYAKADLLYRQVLGTQKKLTGEDHADYAIILDDLGSLSFQLGNYKAADSFFVKSSQVNKKVAGENSAVYIESLGNLAVVYSTMGRNAEAVGITIAVNEGLRKLYGEKDLKYASGVNNLGSIYQDMGNYVLAESRYKKAIAIITEVLGDENIEYAEKINNLATLYDRMDRNIEAELLYKKAVFIKKKILGEHDINYAVSIGNLAFFYNKLGNYSAAEPLYIKSLEINREMLGIENLNYALSLNNLASFYMNMANYTKAELMYKEALQIYKKKVGTADRSYARTLSNLAVLYMRAENFAMADSLYRESLEITRKTVGENHTDYALKLNNLAILYDKTNNFSQSEATYLRVIALYKKLLGEKHTDYAAALNNLAFLYQRKNRCPEADSLFNAALQIRENLLGKLHPSYAISLNNLAGFYYTCNQPVQWAAMIEKTIDTDISSRQASINNFSEAEKEAFLKNTKTSLDLNLSMLWHFKSAMTNPFYKSVTAEQGWLLQGKQLLNNLALSTADSNVQRVYQQWLAVNKTYASAIQLTEERRNQLGVRLDSLQERSQQLEKQLIAAMPAMQSLVKSTGFTAKDIAPKLQKDEAVLQWVAFKYQSPVGRTDSVLYAAFIIQATDTAPKFVTVFEARQLSKLLQQYHGATGRGGIVINNTSPIHVDAALYELVWKPLLPYIKGIKKVYNIPSGLLHKVSFASLKDSVSGKSLIDIYDLHQLLSIHQLVYRSSAVPGNKKLTLMGGALFDVVNTADTTTMTSSVLPTYRSGSTNLRNNIKWSYLEGTKKEVTLVYQFAQQAKWPVQSFTGADASEVNFKKQSGIQELNILHLSTHGFYFPPPAEKRDISGNLISGAKDFPLLRSGIVLSGANNFWGKDTLLQHGEDGIVTAQEVSSMNLLHTDLVVLSACQTALGDISSSEGVYGLQRAFMLAGAKKLLMSLWEVPDAETAELMQLFYTGVFKGNSYYDALRSAQLTLKNKYKDPVKWAGFVLAGE